MKNDIITDHIYPPVPERNYDWSARFEYHDGDTDLTGHGETEEAAVLDLLANAVEYDMGDGSEQESVINWAIEGWKKRYQPPPVRSVITTPTF